MFQQLAQLKQILKAPNQMQMLRNMVGNNPQLNGLLNQLESLTPEQREKKLNEVLNQYGISQEQFKRFFGYK